MNRARSLVVTTALLVCGCVEPNPNLANVDGATRTSDEEDGDTGMMATSSMTTASSIDGDTTASSTTTSTSTGDSDVTGSEDDTTDADPVCDRSTHVCADLPPPNWAGPITLIESTLAAPDPGCSGDYPDHEFTSFADLSAPAATCGCDCTPPAQVTCPTLTLSRYTTNNCTQNAAQTVQVSNCTNFTSGGDGRWRGIANLPNNTSCTSSPSKQVPDATFLARFTACSAAPKDLPCDGGGACLPAPPASSDGRICIYAEGDLMCPPNSGYTERSVYHGTYSDSRDCSQCTCAAQGQCTGNITLTNGQCAGSLPTAHHTTTNTCANPGFWPTSAAWSQTGFTVNCSPSGGAPTGSAQPTEPVTVCCR